MQFQAQPKSGVNCSPKFGKDIMCPAFVIFPGKFPKKKLSNKLDLYIPRFSYHSGKIFKRKDQKRTIENHKGMENDNFSRKTKPFILKKKRK